ncbi:hypothetical protein GCM10022243_52530 [Saccharothrix violaceirubra]|uniref:DUF4097 domain-containing protein n=1 Tax=Saccharothrix violaceirubra TaxID=413306 RepID=A0A7W7TAG6_9PSEU|nr:DUF4097 family beta strand repeat-containing protein [Saccharothrix violaceirubra]MBB4969446.1 hypothetical protein [Saccharothrix violaceirubra]
MVKRIVAAVAVVTVAMGLTSCVKFVQETLRDEHTIKDQIATVRVQNGSGDAFVRSSDQATEVRIVRTFNFSKSMDAPPKDTYRTEGSTLVLEGCGNQCSVDYEVVVPAKDVKIVGENSSGDVRFEDLASVEIDLGSGNATLKGISGAVRLENNSGDVNATDVGGDFTGQLGSGNATLTGMRGAVSVDNNSGDLIVKMAQVKPVRAEAGSGNVDVRVPAGAYKVEAGSGSGNTDVSVKSDPAATVDLVLRANSGDVTLHAA